MRYEVAIIGGGIIGCSTAALLARRGVRVGLFEASAIGAGASGRNLGALQHPFDPALAALHHATLDLYRELAAGSPRFSVPQRPAGLLLLNHDPGAARLQAERLARAVPELSPTYLTPEEVLRTEPSLAPGQAACRLETGYPIPPAAATAAWADAASARGANLRVGQAAEPLVDADRAVGVRLADGSRIGADRVVLAAGPWTPSLASPSGTWSPVHRTWGVTVQVRLGAAAPGHIVEEDEVDAVNRPALAARRAEAAAQDEAPPSLFSIASADGVSTLGSTFLPAEPNPEPVARLLLTRGARHLPALANAEVLGARVCARPQSVDGRPFIGACPGLDELFVCTGHGPWGISTGPGSAAVLVSALLEGVAIPPALEARRLH